MIGIIAFHVLMLVVGLGVMVRIIPPQLVTTALGYLHSTVGITAPTGQKARGFALVWLAATVIVVDGCLLLLLFITRMLN